MFKRGASDKFDIVLPGISNVSDKVELFINDEDLKFEKDYENNNCRVLHHRNGTQEY